MTTLAIVKFIELTSQNWSVDKRDELALIKALESDIISQERRPKVMKKIATGGTLKYSNTYCDFGVSLEENYLPLDVNREIWSGQHFCEDTLWFG